MEERTVETNGSRSALRRLARREVAALSLAGLALLLVTAAALAATGDINQPAGTAGCVSETGAGPCADGRGLDGASGVAMSPDGKSVYVASFSYAVARFNRNTTTGALTQPGGFAGCVSETGAGPCADGHALNGATSVAVSADWKSVYVASQDSDAVARFNRNTTTGALTQPAGAAGCISRTGAGPCADGHGLDRPNSVAVSADGKSVYVASIQSNAVARFNRDTTTGAITQPPGRDGCVSESGTAVCANGHGLERPVRGGGQHRRDERLRRLGQQPRRGALQPQREHRGDHPARRDRRLRQRDGGGSLRQRPWALRPGLGGGQR